MNDRTEIVSGLEEGQTVVAGLTVAAAAKKSQARSPFMPGPPGSNKKDDNKKPVK